MDMKLSQEGIYDISMNLIDALSILYICDVLQMLMKTLHLC